MIGALARVVAILLSLAFCAAAALLVYTALGNSLSLGSAFPSGWDQPVSDTPRREGFTIKAGQSASAIGEELQQRGLIRSALAFRLEVESRGLGNKLETGDYELSPSMSTSEIVSILARGAVRHGTSLTVLEGWRAEQVAARVEELGLARADQVMQLVRSPREHGLAPPDPQAATLEGYLFPETYEFDADVSVNQIVEMMLRQFERRFNEQLRRQAAERGLTLGQAVALASVIERETAKPAERPLVSSVYHNRLARGMRLDADPTVQYAVAAPSPGAQPMAGIWKEDLTVQDLQIDSPYNTYRVTGLPPGPICSPGADSLRAAVAPAQSGYLFFVAIGDGSHVFAETDEQHQANVARYRP